MKEWKREMNKKIFSILTVLMLLGSLFSTGAFAKSENAKQSLVALGDSITFGYNLNKNQNNHHTSKLAFPELIGEENGWRVRNLGVSGWRTDDLLNALKTDKYRDAVRHADYITLNIGSNDLLDALRASGGNIEVIGDMTQIYYSKLATIITVIKGINPNAEIVLYNIYNPFQEMDPRFMIGETVLPPINQGLLELANLPLFKVKYADAYTAFKGNQSTFLLPNGDIHPSIDGHKELARIGSGAFQVLVKSQKQVAKK